MNEYEEGREFFINENFEEARIKFQAANKKDPDNIEYLYALGETIGYLDEFDLSNNYFDKVLKEDPEHFKSIIGKSINLAVSDRLPEALELIDSSIKKYEYGLFYAMKASLLKNMNKSKTQVMKYIDAALEINDKEPYIWYLKGSTLSYFLDWEKALASYNKALKKCDHICILDEGAFISIKDILMQRIIVYETIHQYKKALENTRLLLNKYPDNTQALYLRGYYYFELEDYDNSLINLNRILKKKPDHLSSLNLKAIIFERQNAAKTALRLYERILEVDPEYELAITNISGLYFEKKEYKKACDVAKKALKVNPKNPFALYWGSRAARKLDNLNLARKLEKRLNDPDVDKIFLEKNLQEKIVNETWRLKNLGYNYKLIKREFKLKDRPGRLDILYENKENGDYVVVELKVVKASIDTYKQITNYMDSIKKTIGRNKKIKGLVIATGQDGQFKGLINKNKDISYLDYYKLGLG